MAKTCKPHKKPIEQYDHKEKERCNNPPVGLVTPETDREDTKKTYSYDPHLDPALVWAGKAEHTSFEIPTVSLHIHERIDQRTIIEAVRKRGTGVERQKSLFEFTKENPPLREAIEFYKHKHNWSNRMIAGDSLLVMNSLLEKEGMSGKVQMIYIDPPYGIRYGSNFQMLDTDYDGRSLFPQQVFFPMSGEKDGWSRVAKNLKAEVDEELIEAYRGTVWLPFEAGKNRRIAVKIVDDRGIESLKIVEVARIFTDPCASALSAQSVFHYIPSAFICVHLRLIFVSLSNRIQEIQLKLFPIINENYYLYSGGIRAHTRHPSNPCSIGCVR